MVDARDPLSLENACTRAAAAFADAFKRRDWDALTALHQPDAGAADRRPGLRAEYASRAERIANIKQMADLGGEEMTYRAIALRGDLLALGIAGMSTRADWNVDILTLDEVDTSGLIGPAAAYDLEDLDAAFGELNTRWIASGSPSAKRNRVAVEMLDAINRSDWDALRSMMSDDVEYVDHRPASFGSIGADAYIERSKTLEALGSSFRVRIIKTFDVPGRPDGVLWCRREGLDENGNQVTWDYFGLGQIDEGRIASFETFAIDRLGDAIARATELAAST